MDDDEHDERSAPAFLLPFYVNGTLSVEERERIESALAVDPELRDELQVVREIAALVRAGGAEMAIRADVAPERLTALLKRVGDDGSRASANNFQPRRTLPRRYGLGRFIPPTSNTAWKAAFAAAAVLIVVQAGLLYTRTSRQTDYAVLSGPKSAAPVSPRRLLVQFASDARWADVKTLLARDDLTIVGGPRGDVIEVAVRNEVNLEDEVRRLQASPLVEFAGPRS